MKLNRIFVAAGLALASSTASAFDCTAEVKAIDSALAEARLSTYKHAEVKILRTEGEKLCKEGKKKEAADMLAKAKKILGI